MPLKNAEAIRILSYLYGANDQLIGLLDETIGRAGVSY